MTDCSAGRREHFHVALAAAIPAADTCRTISHALYFFKHLSFVTGIDCASLISVLKHRERLFIKQDAVKTSMLASLQLSLLQRPAE